MERKNNWVDYKEIKSRVSMEMVLKHYNVFEALSEVAGKNVLGCCPIHQGTNQRQFSVYLAKSIWRCFGSCDTGGNVLDFVSKMEGGISIRDSALFLKKLFLDTSEDAPPVALPKEKLKVEQTKNDRKPVIETKDYDTEEKVVNPPLKFILKSLIKDHPFFHENEIKPETVEHFGLGFCTKGLMKERVAIPIHDHEGNLIAYCGRSISDSQAEKEGRYKMPQNFVRSEVIYNLHRQEQGSDTLVLVEDFFSAIKAHQSGFDNFVAIK